MSKPKSKTQKVTKGMPSAVLLSIVIHAALFLLAGMLVVFTVVKKEDQKFEPPKAVERPKMKLRKPKVKVKKTSKPKPTTRIVTKINRASMPDIQLPEMSGMSDGLSGGVTGGFDLMPDLDTVSIFGSGQSIGNDLEGTIYDFKRNRDGKKFSVALGDTDREGFRKYIEKFIQSGWKSSSIARFYRSPRKLYSPTVMIPPTESAFGSWAFGEPTMYPYQYMIHYKGQLVHPEGIRFRFVVMGDNFLLIRVNGRVVLDYKNQFSYAWDGKESIPLNYHLGHWYAYASTWIELEPGIPQDLEIILGEYLGGLFAAMVAVEVEGESYPTAPTPQDNPKLPIFKTAALSRDQKENIKEYMWKGHLDLENGPVFSDYDTAIGSNDEAPATPPAVADKGDTALVESESKLYTWTLKDGKTVEAEYTVTMGKNVVLKLKSGKTVKVPIAKFSEDDIDYLELLNPPKLVLNFKKKTSTFKVLSNVSRPAATGVPVAQNFSGQVEIKQKTMKNYPHSLRVEMYVVGKTYDGSKNYLLLDRQSEHFMLTPENQKSFELTGENNVLRRYEYYGGSVRGETYRGHMILVFDERDKIIAQNISLPWLFDIRDKLKDFPVGRHFNKQGERIDPPRPPFTSTYWSMSPTDY